MTNYLFAAFMILNLAPPSAEVPYRQPQLASAPGLTVMAFGHGGTIYVATSTDQGSTFGKPVKVDEAHVLPLGRHRGPRVAITRGQIVVTAVTGHQLATGEHAHGLPSDGDLMAWRSLDRGKTWSKGVVINDSPTAAREGLHTLAADAQGNLFAAWLDQRSKGTGLYGATSKDGGVTWSKNTRVYESPDGTICECCHPSAALLPNGGLAVMFRNNLGGSRDFYLAQSADGKAFTKPEKVGKGTWKINACPMDGGSLSVNGQGMLTAWRRDEEVFLAEFGKQEVSLGHGKDIAMVRTGGRTIAVWVDGTKIRAWVDGKASIVAEAGAFPALTGLADGSALAAWEDQGAIVVRRIP